MMDRKQLKALFDFMIKNGVCDKALELFLVAHVSLMTPFYAKQRANAIIDLWEFERNKEERKAQITAAKTSDHVEEIVQRSLSRGVPFMISRVTG